MLSGWKKCQNGSYWDNPEVPVTRIDYRSPLKNGHWFAKCRL